MKFKISHLFVLLTGVCLLWILTMRVAAAPGDLDAAFGIGGKLLTDLGGHNRAGSIAIQSDGKFIVGTNYGLARFSQNGFLEQTFGVLPGESYVGVAIQTDGKIVTAANYDTGGVCPRIIVRRFNSDGTLDLSFGTGRGFTFYNPNCQFFSTAHALALQPDGKIVIAGAVTDQLYPPNYDFLVLRLTSTGQFDTTFNLDGAARFAISRGNEEAYSVAVNPTTGKIILAGYSNTLTYNDFTLVLLNSGGYFDLNFGNNGKLVTNTGGDDAAYSVAFQTDGKIIAAGRQSNGANGTDFSLARFTANGAFDTSFGTGGKVVTAFSAYYDAAFGISLQSNGKIIAAGYGADNNALNTGYNFALSRYNTNGSLDATFSGDGKQMTDFSGFNDFGQAVAVQADGKIVVAGYGSNGNDDDLALARYLP